MKRNVQVGLLGRFALGLVLLSACGGPSSKQASDIEAAAAPIDVAECAACGMVVREQPAPRAQLLHRDGERVYFCSIGDLAHYLRAPSRHGDPVAVFVEVLADEAQARDHDPAVIDMRERPWVAAESATYVLGIDRPGIMGPPVLAYDSEAAAQSVIERAGGTKKSWDEITREIIALSDAPNTKE